MIEFELLLYATRAFRTSKLVNKQALRRIKSNGLSSTVLRLKNALADTLLSLKTESMK
jgi:hypothetical protein